MTPTRKFPKALALLSGMLAGIFAVPAPVTPSVWMADNLVVPDGPRAGGRWDPDLTPYVAEIVDAFGSEATNNFGAVRKSQQTGVSIAGIGLCGSYIDGAPCRIGYGLPTIDLLREFNTEKLSPSISATPALRKKVKATTSRSAEGSTASNKKFSGGSLSLINGNSAVDLKSRTLKVGIADEVDSWPDEVGDEGDPLDLFKGRFVAFHATGDWRLLAFSTPQLLGASRIDALFKAGDQRFWHVTCPHCTEQVVLEFKHLKFNRVPPYGAHYVMQCCGVEIAHHEKAPLVRSGKFKPTNPAGLYPSFHVDALISLVTTWDKIAEAWWAAQGDERKLKAFYNLWLGVPFEVRGDAPDWKRLLERREDYAEGKIPARGLLLTGAADVQHSGIWFEVVAWAPNGESWTVRHSFLEGDTTDPDSGAFAALTKIYETQWPDAFGSSRRVDAFAVDAGDGGRFNQVLAWCRGRPQTYAIKGQPGWSHPAIGTPTRVDLTIAGKKITRGATLWPVGTWSLKATYYANLRKDGRKAGAEVDPPGYCHFHDGVDERFCRQMTSEYLGESIVRGRTVRVWKELGPNHLLDCRIYNSAMAEMLGLTRMTEEQWADLARHRGMPQAAIEADLFSNQAIAIASADDKRAAAQPGQAAAAPAAPVDDRRSDWWSRRNG